MGRMHRTVVAAVGTQEDMIRLNRVMLENRDWLEEPDDRPPLTLEELHAQVLEKARWEMGEQAEFLYDMIAPSPYGDAIGERCFYDLSQAPCGLWVARFRYDSFERFQPEDWLCLHQKCDRLPMFALHADTEFALDKGMTLFSGGRAEDDWSLMAEIWLWLIDQYEVGLSPEEIVARLNALKKAMARDDWEQPIGELLASCRENLARVAQGASVTAEELSDAENRRDYPLLYELQTRVAEGVLWDAERHARYLACLEADEQAWAGRD